MKRYLSIVLFLLLFTTQLFSQELEDTTNTLRQFAPNVFIDCFFCDENYIRTEITFVNYVRDPNQADVHALVTTQRTGGGGEEYTLTFIGQNKAAGLNDTLSFTTKQSDTEDLKRQKLTRLLKIGLTRYVARTPLSEFLNINYKVPTKIEEVIDEWDYWVFSARINSNLNGEKVSRSVYLSGGFSATRITHDWKFNFSLSTNYNENKFDWGYLKILSISRGYDFDAMAVKSISEHWSIGGFTDVSTSTFGNTKLRVSVSPAVEYNIFPYSESTRRQFRLMYKLSHENVRYEEETIFDKTAEKLFKQSLSFTIDLRQPWGSISTTVSGSQFLHDFQKRSLRIYTNLKLRLFEGLSLNLFSSYSRISDQLSLRKGAATTEEILLRRTELATNYRYSGYIGLSYTFGSIYNNIVNPRFGGSGGSFYFFN
ncbi:MAG: hypothetical protein QME58_04645 [Bacteroidota bacterium]|nr:hypothetical protein [Bacteroidota bacterium]